MTPARQILPGRHEELLPCPFCGDGEVGHRDAVGLKPQVVIIQAGHSRSSEYGIECYRCGGRTADCRSVEQAIQYWNMRPDQVREVKD